jgi:PAS domain S-box-containing protein
LDASCAGAAVSWYFGWIVAAITAALIADSLPDGALALDHEGRPVYVNAAGLRALGLDPSSSASAAWSRLRAVSPDVDAALALALSGKASRIPVLPECPIAARFEPLAAGGEIAGAVALLRACAGRGTPAKLCAAKAERRRNELLETMLERVPLMISVRDREGRLAYANGAWRNGIGRIAPDPFVCSPEALAHTLAASTEWRDFRFEGPDGDVLEFACASVRVSPDAILCIAQDVTARNSADRIIQESEGRLRALLHNSAERVTLLDGRGRILQDWARSVSPLLGYNAGELAGSSAFDLLHPEDQDKARTILEAIIADPGRVETGEFRCRHVDGSWRSVEVTASNLTHLESVRGVVANARDVTDARHAERELRASHDRLRELTGYLETAREQERTRIAREIHDELGQMLTVLNMDLERLAVNCDTKCPDAAGLVHRIEAAAVHVRASMDSVKRISAELRPGVLDHLGLGAAIEWQAGEFEKRFGIRCSVDGADHALVLMPDRSTAVFRIFQETLTNIARHANARNVAVIMRAADGWLVLRIADDGKGIDEGLVHDPKSLGLLGMKERALLLGGSLELRGAAGSGTTITLRIPTGPPVAEPEADANPTGAPPLAGEAPKILIADDHAVFRHGLRQLLAERFPGAEIGEAIDGEQTLRLANAQAWDVLILDLSMPGRSGLDVLSALQASGNEVPVLVLSTHSEDECRLIASRAGAHAYLTKGQSSAEIVDAVRRVLSSARV